MADDRALLAAGVGCGMAVAPIQPTTRAGSWPVGAGRDRGHADKCHTPVVHYEHMFEGFGAVRAAMAEA
ncbi:MAG: hypothetical protein ACRD1K_18340, partial [Acidimicrobiales bacterium]